MENKERWFLVEHKQCGALTTIEEKTFSESFRFNREVVVSCPNCGKTLIDRGKINTLLIIFEKYALLDTPEKFPIKEIDLKDFKTKQSEPKK